MDRANLYQELCSFIEELRSTPLPELRERVGQTSRMEKWTEEGVLVLEATISALNQSRDAIEIHASAYGPSHWNLERLDESVVVKSE